MKKWKTERIVYFKPNIPKKIETKPISNSNLNSINNTKPIFKFENPKFLAIKKFAFLKSKHLNNIVQTKTIFLIQVNGH